MRLFWQLAYAFYGLGGRAVSSKRSRLSEFALLGMAGVIAAMWAYALATNYSANVKGVPAAAAIIVALTLAGLFFRHVRLRSAENAHYLAQKRNGG
jgi:hypothetical protein